MRDKVFHSLFSIPSVVANASKSTGLVTQRLSSLNNNQRITQETSLPIVSTASSPERTEVLVTSQNNSSSSTLSQGKCLIYW